MTCRAEFHRQKQAHFLGIHGPVDGGDVVIAENAGADAPADAGNGPCLLADPGCRAAGRRALDVPADPMNNPYRG